MIYGYDKYEEMKKFNRINTAMRLDIDANRE